MSSVNGQSFMDVDWSDPSTQIYFRNYAIAIVCVIITTAVVYIASTDNHALDNSFYLYSVFVIFPIIIAIILISPALSAKASFSSFAFYIGVGILFLLALYEFYKIMNPATVAFASGIVSVIFILAIIVFLAIVYRLFFRFSANMGGWTGIYLKTIFYLPCLLLELLQALFSELKSTPKMVLALLLLEMVLLLGYLYLPKIVDSVLNASSTGVVLLRDPLFLTKQITISDTNFLYPPESGIDIPTPKPHSISMWVYVTDHSSSNSAYSKETSIFRYGSSNQAIPAHLRITFVNHKWRIYSGENYVEMILPMQSWNHIVINAKYDNSAYLDVFINGKLTHSVRQPEMPKYDKSDAFFIGDTLGGAEDQSGLHGAICNVVYYAEPLTQQSIVATYNMYRFSVPPVY